MQCDLLLEKMGNKMIEKIRKRLIDNNYTDKETFDLLSALSDRLELSRKIEDCLYDSDLYLVYKHTDPNGKVYIGITQNHPQTRWNEGGGYERQSKFYKAIQKYGWIHFRHEILAAGLSREEALELENKLIIAHKSYDEQYGYNTRVDLGAENSGEIADTKNIAQKNKDDIFVISQALVEKYSIKTVNNQIYYLKDDEYVLEKVYPILEKELIVEHKIPTKRHQEIIKQIGIISYVPINKISREERKYFFVEDESEISKWIVEESLSKEALLEIPTVVMYEQYVKWCKSAKCKKLFGKKQFFKIIEDMFGFEKKQRSDGKRYFVNKL